MAKVEIELNNNQEVRDFVENVNIVFDVVLFCPKCKEQHIDESETNGTWKNPPHKKHLCHFCGNIWKAANIHTNGVKEIN